MFEVGEFVYFDLVGVIGNMVYFWLCSGWNYFIGLYIVGFFGSVLSWSECEGVKGVVDCSFWMSCVERIVVIEGWGVFGLFLWM